MTKIVFILVVCYFLQPLTAFNGADGNPKLGRQKTYERDSRRDSRISHKHRMYSASDEESNESDESQDNINHFGPVQVYDVNRQKIDRENQLCETHESRPNPLKMKKPKKIRFRTKDHDRQKIFIYANLPTPKCECNQTQRQVNPAYPLQAITTTVHPFYERYSHIPELKEDNILKQQISNKEENIAKNRKNKYSESSEKDENVATNTKHKISKPSKGYKNSKIASFRAQDKDQENKHFLENNAQSTSDTFEQTASMEDNQGKHIKTSKTSTVTTISESRNDKDEMEVGETINYEQIQEPGVLSMRQTEKVQFKPVYLKNYQPIVPITAESNLFKTKQKREKPYENDIPLNGHRSRNSNQYNLLNNYEENTLKYSKLNNNRKTLNQIANYRQRTSANGQGFFKHRNYPNNDGTPNQSIEKYVEIPLSDYSEEYSEYLKTLTTNNNNNQNNEKILPDYAMQSQESIPKAPLSIYLNKIIKKRCNEDHEKFPFISIQDNNIDSNTDDQGAAEDDVSGKNSNQINSNEEDKNKSEVEVKDDYINNKMTMDTNPLMCNNWSKNNGNEIDGDPSKCALRPAYRDLYGYQQHLTK